MAVVRTMSDGQIQQQTPAQKVNMSGGTLGAAQGTDFGALSAAQAAGTAPPPPKPEAGSRPKEAMPAAGMDLPHVVQDGSPQGNWSAVSAERDKVLAEQAYMASPQRSVEVATQMATQFAGIPNEDIPGMQTALDAMMKERERIAALGPEHAEALAQLDREIMNAQSRITAAEDFARLSGANDHLASMARGEGLEETPAQQQLRQQFEQAQSASQAALSGPTGGMSAAAQRISANRESRLDQRQQRISDLVKAQEQAMALRLSTDLTNQMATELAQRDFADAGYRESLARIYSSAKENMADLENQLTNAQYVADARKRAEQEAQENAWMDTIIGGAFTAGGMALGAYASGGNPMGAMAGAQGGTLAYNSLTSLL